MFVKSLTLLVVCVYVSYVCGAPQDFRDYNRRPPDRGPPNDRRPPPDYDRRPPPDFDRRQPSDYDRRPPPDYNRGPPPPPPPPYDRRPPPPPPDGGRPPLHPPYDRWSPPPPPNDGRPPPPPPNDRRPPPQYNNSPNDRKPPYDDRQPSQTDRRPSYESQPSYNAQDTFNNYDITLTQQIHPTQLLPDYNGNTPNRPVISSLNQNPTTPINQSVIDAIFGNNQESLTMKPAQNKGQGLALMLNENYLTMQPPHPIQHLFQVLPVTPEN